MDLKNEPFKKFVYYTFYEIQDSIDIVMPHNDTTTGQQKENFDLKKSGGTMDAINSYQKKMNIFDKDKDIIRYTFVLDAHVKKFYRLYIQKVYNGKIPAEK